MTAAQAQSAGAEMAARNTVQQADFIVAVVNSEPLTNHEVQVELQRAKQQLAQQGRPVPDARALAAQVLEQLIGIKIQLQLAQEMGIKVDEPSIDQAEQMVARQNQMGVDEMLQRLAQEGVDRQEFRNQLRDQILLTRLREREVEARVRVGDADVDQYIQSQSVANQANQVLNLAQLLVAVPEVASAQQLAELEARAQRALARARAGEDFAALVKEFSDAADKVNGGLMGLKPASRYPELFLEATRGVGPGGLTGLVRSGAGFHILKVVEKRAAGLPPVTVTQTHSRHILLLASAQQSEAQAVEKLRDFRQRVESGKADFAALARQHSQDGSAGNGGDLGWVSPGQFVPEFESVMNRLAAGQISEPLISRFGVHLIQVLERRQSTLGEQEQREMVRNMLRRKKLEEAYASWMQDLRARAYVELREQPQ